MITKAIDLKISCGCGFKTHELKKALEHSATYEHQMCIAGSVDVSREQVVKEKSDVR